ncbi:hypothetical protein OG946_02675 [Streptomyces sp. NBC_01808]|uniref:hypothetical protein n=1 Tax=Streptomyces sp. NBC_01808 TaxID=2975947 RepID=UPI002DDBFDBD|nr:hypothetical protein [Streptomyces sp. NBC_01808]WSA36373.1 hypothetical protein OG946_02675 [Streptomyces sp. NBC_01808]
MARTRTDARLLRREMPGAVGLLADAADFAAMRRYASFLFDDHAAYLRQVEGVLRARATQGAYTTVALFDPPGFARFCAERGLEPDTPASRCRYVAESAARGPAVPYGGQPMDRLVPQLLDAAARSRSRERAATLLAAAGRCEDCGEHRADAALARAGLLVDRLTEALGPGAQHVVTTVRSAGFPLVAVARSVDPPGPPGPPRLRPPDGEALRLVLAAGIATSGTGGVVARTTGADGRERVRGWRLRDGWLAPLTEKEVYAAYCTNARTGAPLPPEPDVTYSAGTPLPRPEKGCHR